MNYRTASRDLLAVRLLAGLLLALALCATIGIITGNSRLSSMLLKGSPISPSTAFGLLFLSFSATAIAWNRRRAAVIPALLVLSVGSLHLWAHLTGTHRAVHTWLLQTVVPFIPPGSTRVSLTNACLLVLSGAVLLVLSRPKPPASVLAIAGAVCLGVTGSRLIGYVAGSSQSYDWGSTLGMSLPTALCFGIFGTFLVIEARRAAASSSTILSLSAAGVALLCSSGAVMMVINHELVKASRAVEQTLDIETRTERCVASIARMEACARGYALSGDPWMAQRKQVNERMALRDLARLEEFSASNSSQLEDFREIRRHVHQKIDFNERLMEARRADSLEQAAQVLGREPPPLSRRLVELFDRVRARQHEALEVSRQRSEALATNAQRVLTTGCLLAIGLVAAAFYQTSRARREIELAKQQLEVAHEQLERRVAERTSALTASERNAREMQTRLQTVLNSSPIVMWAIDANGIFTAIDGKGVELQQIDRDRLLGTSIFDLIKDNPELTEITRRALRGEIRHSEVHFKGVYFENRYGILNKPDGSLETLVCVSIDITSRRDAERLALSERTAQEASRLKSTFLANMSHEIRTPMNGVIGMTTLLRQTSLNSEQREMADVVQKSAENLLTIIDDILDFSKIEAGKLKMDPLDTDLRQLIEEILAALSPKAFEKKLEVVNDFHPGAPMRIVCDPVRLRQVITNFVGNAIKFTEAGEVVVTTDCLADTPASALLRISVRDTGIGISAEGRDKLFQAFSQADSSVTRRFGGSGLGLTISRQLIELMGGKVGVSSELGQGSTFWCEIEFPKSSAQPPSDTRPGRSLRALLIDDHPRASAVLTRQLGELGLSAQSVASLEEAVEELKASHGRSPYDVILLDDEVEGTPREKCVELLRAQPAAADIPVLLLSSKGLIFDVSMPAYRHFASVLAKPVRWSQLRRSITDILRPVEHAPHGSITADKSPNFALRILLAEDDRVNHMVAVGMLGSMGHRIDVAVNGAEAFARFCKQSYDLVLMDCHMPVLDGYGAARKIREFESHTGQARTPIVALTASAMAQDRLACLEAGMDDFTSKPILIDELRAVLRRSTRKQPPVQWSNLA